MFKTDERFALGLSSPTPLCHRSAKQFKTARTKQNAGPVDLPP
jgi:hypothetical protein